MIAKIVALYLESPCSGTIKMEVYLARKDIPISRDRLRKLIGCMGLRAIYHKPLTIVPGDLSECFRSLVDLNQDREINQAGAKDIT